MTTTRHSSPAAGLALSAPSGWAVRVDASAAPGRPLLVAAPSAAEGAVTRVEVASTGATGGTDEVVAAALEELLDELVDPLLLDLEETVLAGGPAHRALVVGEVEGRSETRERWWRRDGGRLVAVTVHVESDDVPAQGEALRTVATSLEVAGG